MPLRSMSVRPPGSSYIDEVRALQLVYKLGKTSAPICFFAERRIELQHGRFQKPQLRLHRPALQHGQRTLYQRHRLRNVERRRTLPRTTRCPRDGPCSRDHDPAARGIHAGAAERPALVSSSNDS